MIPSQAGRSQRVPVKFEEQWQTNVIVSTPLSEQVPPLRQGVKLTQGLGGGSVVVRLVVGIVGGVVGTPQYVLLYSQRSPTNGYKHTHCAPRALLAFAVQVPPLRQGLCAEHGPAEMVVVVVVVVVVVDGHSVVVVIVVAAEEVDDDVVVDDDVDVVVVAVSVVDDIPEAVEVDAVDLAVVVVAAVVVAVVVVGVDVTFVVDVAVVVVVVDNVTVEVESGASERISIAAIMGSPLMRSKRMETFPVGDSRGNLRIRAVANPAVAKTSSRGATLTSLR